MEHKVSLVSFSLTGGRLAASIAGILREMNAQPELCTIARYAESLGQKAVEPDLATWCRTHWAEDELIIFVGASGIAVRTIAPFVKSKVSDPAILVVDEGGHFVISLLSGHLGGANLWTTRIAESIGAIPVITTATDVQHRFAVDVWAKDNGLRIDNMKAAKEVSAAVLRGETVYLCCPEGEAEGELPKELKQVTKAEMERVLSENGEAICILISPYVCPNSGERILHLIPQCVTLGIGCRKDHAAEAIHERAMGAMASFGIDPRSIEGIGSIDLKKDEKGIHALAKELGVPFTTYTAEQLHTVSGDFTPSKFVAGVTGVDNVCERSAVLGSGNGRRIMEKQAGGGVTVAAAMRQWRVRF